MKSRISLLATCAVFASAWAFLRAQTATDHNEGLKLTRVSTTNDYELSWWGRAPGTYFVKYSSNLVNWHYLPEIFAGDNEPLSMWVNPTGLGGTERFFFKLQFSDQLSSNPPEADFDGDGVSNQSEVSQDTDPLEGTIDSDSDSMADDWEIYWFSNLYSSTGFEDSDGDGVLDKDEFLHRIFPTAQDSDLDGLPDGLEIQMGTSPRLVDSDGDTMHDGWEVAMGLNPLSAADAALDADGDGLTNLEEFNLGSAANNADTDRDGIPDKVEIQAGYDPKSWDTDVNGISDGFEIQYGIAQNTPADEDNDGDGLTNIQEYRLGTSPNSTDSDGDGVNDSTENSSGADPVDNSDAGVPPPPSETIQVAFQVSSTGKTQVGSCAVCHNLSVSVGGRLLLDGESITMKRGKAKDVKLIDKPDPFTGGSGVPPHDTARFVIWPQAVGSQTITASSDKSYVSVTKDNILEYLLDNRESLLTEDSAWDDAALGKKAVLLSSALKLAVDTNNDGQISSTYDSDTTTAETPHRFWVNDDDDTPGVTAQSDFLNTAVDGAGDLQDFFPVLLNIKQALTVFPAGPTVKYKLKQADGALNMAYTSLVGSTALSFRSGSSTTGYGPLANQPAATATTDQVTASGFELSSAFLGRIVSQGEGVILLEWRAISGAPLVLSVEKDGVEVLQTSVHISSLRLGVDSGKVHHGFDPPNKSEEDDLLNPSTYWASVVQGSTNNILNLDLPTSLTSGIEWRVDPSDASKVSISPAVFSAGSTSLTISGLGSGATSVQEATLRLVNTASPSISILILKVLVLPQREQELAIYILEDPNAPLSQYGSSPVVSLPSNSDILTAVNDSMKQAGIRFTLHSSSGTYQYPYDTKGIDWNGTDPTLATYSNSLPTRTSDGVMTREEATAFLDRSPFTPTTPSAADTLFPVPGHHSTIKRIILIKESGIPYSAYPGQWVRGMSGGIVLFVRNLPGNQIPVVAAHEVGHNFNLSTAGEDDGHDQPPFPYVVVIDQPNGVAPVHPGNSFIVHKPAPNSALMQSGTPESAGLPWSYGRWMRFEDWVRANNWAGGIH